MSIVKTKEISKDVDNGQNSTSKYLVFIPIQIYQFLIATL